MKSEVGLRGWFRVTVAFVCLVAAHGAHPNDADHNSEYFTGVAFHMTLFMLEEFDQRFADGVEWTQDALDISESQATAFVNYLLTVRDIMESEADAAVARESCLGRNPYDVRERVLYEHYSETRDILGEATRTLFVAWIAEQAASISHSHVTMTHDTIAGLCNEAR